MKRCIYSILLAAQSPIVAVMAGYGIPSGGFALSWAIGAFLFIAIFSFPAWEDYY